MIVADTSALVTLASAEVIETVVDEFEVHTTQVVVSELRDTGDAYQHGYARRVRYSPHASLLLRNTFGIT